MRVTLGIVTRNRPERVRRLLLTIREFGSEGPDEILLYDNSENDATEQVVEGLHDVHYTRGVKRQAGGQNEILRSATGQIIAFLDDDSLPRPDYFRFVREDYENDHSGTVASVGGPAITVNPDGTPRLRVHSGAGYNRVLDGSQILIAADHSPCWVPEKICDVDILRGANMTFLTSALHKIGGFDETYERGTWGEETDPQLALRRLGYRILYDPRVRVDHYMAEAGGNRASNDPVCVSRIAYGNGRNQIYLLRKHQLLTPTYLVRWILWSFIYGDTGLRSRFQLGADHPTEAMPSLTGVRGQSVMTVVGLKTRYAVRGWTRELLSPTKPNSTHHPPDSG